MGQERQEDSLERAKAGDGLAFGELLAPILDPAFQLAMTMLNDRAAAEDAVQEAALDAWRKFRGLRSGAALRPWFLTIVANKCRSARRTRWWRVMRFAEVPTCTSDIGSDRGWADQLDLDAALDRLPKHHLLALTLYYHLDLPIEEVARVLRCSTGAARLRIHRALAAVRPAMGVEIDS